MIKIILKCTLRVTKHKNKTLSLTKQNKCFFYRAQTCTHMKTITTAQQYHFKLGEIQIDNNHRSIQCKHTETTSSILISRRIVVQRLSYTTTHKCMRANIPLYVCTHTHTFRDVATNIQMCIIILHE